MKSKAHIKSHPIHPILVGFPITLYTGTLLFDVLEAVYPGNGFATTARYMNIGGIVFAVLAAVPGIIDYAYTVPPKSSAKKRAAKHGLINTAVVALFALALYLRQDIADNQTIILIIEAIGFILTGVAGWMGGTLAYRNQIGVDVRYAGAGKWKEEHINSSEKSVVVATADELQMNQMKLIHLNGKRIVLGRSDSGYAAFDDRCTHRGGSLAGGALACDTVQCPWHGSQFNVLSGVVTAGPAKEGLTIYKVWADGGKIMLAVRTER